MQASVLSRAVIGASALLCLTVAACSPSAKNETQYWENHKKSAQEFKLSYPGFAAILDAQMSAATTAHEAAAKEADEEKKAEAMKAANAIAGEVLSPLNEVKYKSEGVQNTIQKLADLKLGKPEDARRRDAMNAASNELSKVQLALAEAKPATKEEAVAALKPQISALISAQGAADRAYDSLKPQKPAKSKKKK